MAGNKYCIDLAKRGVAGCKKCKAKIDKGVVRIGKIVPNPFTDEGGEMKQWFHVRCMFEQLSRARATTKKIESTDDLEGWDDIADENKAEVLKCLTEFKSSSAKKAPQKAASKKTPQKTQPEETPQETPPKKAKTDDSFDDKSGSTKDDSFREFRKICTKISDVSSYLEKTAVVSEFISKGSDGKGFQGDIFLWMKMLLPGVNKRVFNLQSKQLVKLFSQIFQVDHEEMLESLEQGDVAETIRIFFEDSETFKPVKKSTLSLQQVDKYLDVLTTVTKEDEQTRILRTVAKKCTGNDLKMFIRLIKHDLRINAGAKHILDAIHPTAYDAFQASRNLEDVIKRSLQVSSSGSSQKELTVKASLMTPVLPMLAQVCKSVENAFKRCPNGLLVEIKYDGERVQLHKRGSEFSYFSRSLKPVMPHKVAHLKDYIPKAFPSGDDLILDSEILLVDHAGKPLPFGTLGKHKKEAFKDANVCLFVFDCLQFNNENIMNLPLTKRRKILESNMTPIKNHVMFSEIKAINDPTELGNMIKSVIKQGLEGIIIKDKKSIYEPGKRHWLKVKKDYLDEGGMADSADLVVLGAYYGTGNKGGIMSTYLMGCYNERTEKWCTVTKVSGGLDDATLERLQTELNMKKISKDPLKVPSWLNINKPLVPDFISVDPKKSPVWEITGAEFTKTDIHTANGVSIRFPRITKMRSDKTWKEATSLKQLLELYRLSKETSDMIGLAISKTSIKKEDDDDDGDNNNDGSGEDSGFDLKPEINDDSDNDGENKPSTSGIKISTSPKILCKEARQSTKKRSSDEALPSAKRTLPNVFTGIKLYIPSDLQDAKLLHRYFVAYDGDLLKEEYQEDASLAISYPNMSKNPPSKLRLVTTDWLWDSIKLQKRLPLHLYTASTSGS